MKVFQYAKLGLENLELVERETPVPGPFEALVKFHAATLNYRDLLFADGSYNPRPTLPAVPLSDGAGEVVAVGEGVTRWEVGDRVCPSFFQGWSEGPRDAAKSRTALGAGQLDGVLGEYGAFHEQGLVRIPEHLSYEEAATLPCAAVTAWHAIVNVGRLKPGDTLLTLGTGGVSVFAIQFGHMLGARVIATSSDDEKLQRVKELGASETINYKATPEWDKEVLRLTGGVGVDLVVEVGGAGTLGRSVNATRIEGCVALIGVLAGSGGSVDPMRILMKSIHLQGVFVGSRQTFEEMNRAISCNRLKPVISTTFPFQEAREALTAMRTASHFGKILIKF